MKHCVIQIFELGGRWEPASSGVSIQLYNGITCDVKCICFFFISQAKVEMSLFKKYWGKYKSWLNRQPEILCPL